MSLERISNKILWSKKYCKKCNICIEICPVKALCLKENKMSENGKCIKCKFCEKYCPDFAIEVIQDEKTDTQ